MHLIFIFLIRIYAKLVEKILEEDLSFYIYHQGIRILNIPLQQNWPILKLGPVVLVLGEKKERKEKNGFAGLWSYADINRRHVIDKACSNNSCGTLLI